MKLRPRVQVLLAVVLLLLGVVAFLVQRLNFTTESDRGESVFLLHGMGRSGASLMLLSHQLESRGYEVWSFSYNEQERTLAEIADDLKRFIATSSGARPYHLVGHSLGNIIIREGFRGEYPEGLERIVMLAPPNRPAVLAAMFADNPIYQWRTGDAGQRLSDEEFYRSLPAPKVPFGIIAGTTGQSLTFEEPNDGVVLLESTKLEGMTDWISLPHAHTFIMNGQDTQELVVRFLERGSF